MVLAYPHRQEACRRAACFNFVGETIGFRNPLNGDTFLAQITSIHRYEGEDPLTAYLENETLARALPVDDVRTLEDGRRVYLAFWSVEQIRATGMLGIQVKPLPESTKQ